MHIQTRMEVGQNHSLSIHYEIEVWSTHTLCVYVLSDR
jgi:hypothetical protein